MLDTLTRIFTAVEFVLWAREMQRKRPGNPLHMIGEMDYVSEIHDAIEEHYATLDNSEKKVNNKSK